METSKRRHFSILFEEKASIRRSLVAAHGKQTVWFRLEAAELKKSHSGRKISGTTTKI
jgi:hypothetical protein